MGRVRNKMVKRAARQMIERYYSRLTFDFDSNKRMADEVATTPTKRVRNKIAGFVTHLMKRISRGPVRGISLKLQEEERERRMDFIPEKSVLDVETVHVDADSLDMLKSLDFAGMTGVQLQDQSSQQRGDRRQNRDHSQRKPKKDVEKSSE